MRSAKYLALFSTLIMLGACSESVAPFEPETVDVPAGTPANGPRLSGGSDQPLLLSWMEEDDSGSSLLWSQYEDGLWSPPGTVVDGVNMFVNWADMPSVQPMGDGHLAAHWLEMSADQTYAYDVVFVQSQDGGETWSEPMRPHSDGTPTEHGFVSMYPDGPRVGLIWLDGRKFVNEVTDNPVDSGMTLRAAFIDRESGIQGEQLVDELICDCCQTDIAVSSNGPVAVYRNRTPEEIRDIWVTRFVDGSWSSGEPLGNDNWEIPGCPVNGPSIAANGDRVAAAWFTAANQQPKVKLRLSNDGGLTFGESIEVASGKTLGRVGVAFIDDSDVAVSWLRTGMDGGNEVAVQRFSANGEPGDIHTVARNVGSFSVPQIAVSGNDVIFVWTETEGFVNSVHSARVPAASL